jgi:hypothetical protein
MIEIMSNKRNNYKLTEPSDYLFKYFMCTEKINAEFDEDAIDKQVINNPPKLDSRIKSEVLPRNLRQSSSKSQDLPSSNRHTKKYDLYEKYKSKGGKMAPEVRLLIMLIMSGVTFHLSKTLFGSDGLGESIRGNSNILNGFLGGLLGGKGNLLSGDRNEPAEARGPPPSLRNAAALVKNHNKSKKSETATATTTTSSSSETESGSGTTERRVIEDQKKLLADERALFENMKKQQEEMFAMQMQAIKNQAHQTNQVSQIPKPDVFSKQKDPVNQVLSGIAKPPRYQENPLIYGNAKNNQLSDALDSESSVVKSPKKSEYEETLDTLSAVDIDECLESISNRSTKKPKISTRSASRKTTETISESAKKTGNRGAVVRI